MFKLKLNLNLKFWKTSTARKIENKKPPTQQRKWNSWRFLALKIPCNLAILYVSVWLFNLFAEGDHESIIVNFSLYWNHAI